MELDVAEEQLPRLSAIDAGAAKQQSKLGCKGEYRPLVQEDKHGNRRFRCKVSVTGQGAAKFWDNMRQPLGNVKSLELAQASVIPVVAFTKVWSTAGMWGVTAELRHCVVDNMASGECPEVA